MKIAIAAVVLAVTSGSALAQSTTAKVPTGIDVAGSAYYVIPTGTTKVVQIAEPCTPRAEMTRACINTARGGERPDKESANK